MAEIIMEKAVQRESGYLYYIDGKGNVMKKARGKGGEKSVVLANAIERKKGCMYFVDGQGNIGEAKMKQK